MVNSSVPSGHFGIISSDMCKPIDYYSFKDDPEYIDVVCYVKIQTLIDNDMSRDFGERIRDEDAVWDDIKWKAQHVIISILKDKNTNTVMFNMKSEDHSIKSAIRFFNSF